MATVVILLLAGAALLLSEIVLPGMVAGTVGVLCLIAGVFVSFNRYGPQLGTLVLAIVTIGLLAGFAVWVKYFPDSRAARWFISKRTLKDPQVVSGDLLHRTGTALSNLRPSGMANIGGRRVDVVTEGGMVERGTPVRVVAVEGMRVVVRAVETAAFKDETTYENR